MEYCYDKMDVRYKKTISCQSCLSDDRYLTPIKDLKVIYEAINDLQLSDVFGGLCWECVAIIKNYTKLKKKTAKSQMVLNHKPSSKLFIIKQSSLAKQSLFITQTEKSTDPVQQKIKQENNPENKHKDYGQFTTVETETPNSLPKVKYVPVEKSVKSPEKKSPKKKAMLTKDESDSEDDTPLIHIRTSNEPHKTGNVSQKTGNDCLKTGENSSTTALKVIEPPIEAEKPVTIKQEVEDCQYFSIEITPDVSNYDNDHSDDRPRESDTGGDTTDFERMDVKIERMESESEDGNVDAAEGKYVCITLTEEEMLDDRKYKGESLSNIKYRCDQCILGFQKQNALYLHSQENHNPSIGEFSCDICSVCFKTISDMTEHREKHYRSYKCNLCVYKTSELKNVIHHCAYQHAQDKKVAVRKPKVVREGIKTSTQRSRECRMRKMLREAAENGLTIEMENRCLSQRMKDEKQFEKLRQAAEYFENLPRVIRTVKSPAQRAREWRARKKLREAANKIPRPIRERKTATQRSQEFRARQKMRKLDEMATGGQPSKKAKLSTDGEDDEDYNPVPVAVKLEVDFENENNTDSTFKVSLITENDNEPSTHVNAYTKYYQHSNGHLDFYNLFVNNTFGHSCLVCDRLWCEKELKKSSKNHEEILKMIVPKYVPGTLVQLCSSCKIALDKRKIPTLSTYNGFYYPPIPPHLPPLGLVSERLISPKVPFVQIRRLRTTGEDEIYAQIVNLPVSNNPLIKTLPRNIDEDCCVYVNVDKKLCFKSSDVLSLVEKNSIKEWLKYLVNTPLYSQRDITVDEDFLNDDENDDEKIDIEDLSEVVKMETHLTARMQTLIWNEDKALLLASSESNSPCKHYDKYAEELSFPTIYGGQFKEYREGVHPTSLMQVTSELRRTDRRGVVPEHLLYMAYKIMRLRVKESVAIAIRHVGNDTSITKEQLQSESYLNECIKTNLSFLRCLPNSAWYWSDQRKDLLAIIRQIGPPTAFMSLNANETGWNDLLKLLFRLKNDGANISNEELAELTQAQKAKLVHDDAVTCAIHFNKMLTCLLNVLQYKKRSPFGKYRVVYYFKRMAFQLCGSPKAYILLWLANAPTNLLSNDKEVIEMIDELVSVASKESSGFIEHQVHKHSIACYEKNETKCRFGAPFFPVRRTITLFPFKDTEACVAKEKLKRLKNHYEMLCRNLERYDYTDFEHFYSHNKICSDSHYHNILRAGLDRPKLLYRRTPTEKWHNTFNPFVLHHLKSEMDFQIIQDEYACALYISEYVSKSNRGISYLQKQMIEIIEENPDFDMVEITKKMSADAVHCLQMSAQEAAWYLLREPLSKSSVMTVYIPTVNATERQRISYTLNELTAVDDATDVLRDNWFDTYEARPDHMADITLAQFVSKYYKNSRGEYAERKEHKVIRYRNYDPAVSLDDYKREMVLLHIPFKNEQEDVLNDDKYLKMYEDNLDLITERRKEFEPNPSFERLLEICNQMCTEDEDLRNEGHGFGTHPLELVDTSFN